MEELVNCRLALTELQRLFTSPLAPTWDGAGVLRKATRSSLEMGDVRGVRVRFRTTLSSCWIVIALMVGSRVSARNLNA